MFPGFIGDKISCPAVRNLMGNNLKKGPAIIYIGKGLVQDKTSHI